MFNQDDEYGIEDSDEGNVESSEDELDVMLHGTPEQKLRLRRHSLGKKSSEDEFEDEFEKEIESELNTKMTSLEKQHGKPDSKVETPGGSMTIGSNQEHQERACYDQAYFDSDSDDEGTREEKCKRKHPVISDDDLLYDPAMDDEDQLWVDRERRRHQPRGTKASKKPRPAPSSDALLDCPACMTTLCIDCQRHDVYKHQYRAMFVMNCKVDNTEKLKFPEPKSKQNKKKKKSRMDDGSNTEETPDGSSNDLYNPVKCSECCTVVGVYDSDEIYHFFNVLASYG